MFFSSISAEMTTAYSAVIAKISQSKNNLLIVDFSKCDWQNENLKSYNVSIRISITQKLTNTYAKLLTKCAKRK